jgi:hypothetical protein
MRLSRKFIQKFLYLIFVISIYLLALSAKGEFFLKKLLIGAHGEDSHLRFLVWRNFLKDSISKGYFPFWNKFQSYGESFIGNIESGLFYPTAYLALIMDPVYSVNLEIILHILFLNFTLYFWIKNKFESQLAVLLSTALCLTPILLCHISSGSLGAIIGISWLPIFLCTVDPSYKLSSSRRFFLCIISLVAIVLSGAVEIFYYLYIFCFFMIIIFFKNKRYRLIQLTTSFSIAVLLCSVQLLPSLMSFLSSTRFNEGISTEHFFALYLSDFVSIIKSSTVDNDYMRTSYFGILPICFFLNSLFRKGAIEITKILFFVIIMISFSCGELITFLPFASYFKNFFLFKMFILFFILMIVDRHDLVKHKSRTLILANLCLVSFLAIFLENYIGAAVSILVCLYLFFNMKFFLIIAAFVGIVDGAIKIEKLASHTDTNLIFHSEALFKSQYNGSYVSWAPFPGQYYSISGPSRLNHRLYNFLKFNLDGPIDHFEKVKQLDKLNSKAKEIIGLGFLFNVNELTIFPDRPLSFSRFNLKNNERYYLSDKWACASEENIFSELKNKYEFNLVYVPLTNSSCSNIKDNIETKLELKLVNESPNNYEFEINTLRDAILVIKQNYSNDWVARDLDRKSNLKPVIINNFQQGFFVSKGKTRLIVEYNILWFWVGCALTSFTCIFVYFARRRLLLRIY